MARRTRSGERAAVVATPGSTETQPAGRTTRVAETLKAHQHRTAAGIFALLVLVHLWPALLGGRLLSPTALLYEATPWQHLAPTGIRSYVNLELGDVPFSYHPWNVLARGLLHAGTFPAWNPYAFGGTPLFANFELAWLSPFSLPVWILPLRMGLAVAAALKLWAAGFGTYLLVRELKLGFWPGALAGTSFALCAFNVVWLSHGVFVSVAALLPWALWLAERLLQRARQIDAVALAGIVAAILFGGHPGTQLHALAALVLFVLVRVAMGAAAGGRPEITRRLVLIGGAFVLGGLLSAVVLLPAQQAAVDTTGAALRSSGSGFPGSHMPFGVLRTLMFPDWWGRSAFAIPGPVNYRERTFYTGAATLLFALLALISPGGWRRKAPFAVLGAVGLLAPVQGSGLHELVNHLPLFDRVQNQRITLWLQLSVAVLAAFGLQALLDLPARQRRAWAVVAAGGLAALVALMSVRLGGDTLSRAIHVFVHRDDAATRGSAVAAVGWWLVFLTAAAAALLLVQRRPDRRRLLGGVVVLLATLDMLHFAHGYQPMGPSESVPPRTPAIAFLMRHADEGRIAGVEFAVPQDWSTIYGLRDARGNDAPQPTLRFAYLWSLLNSVNGRYTLAGLAWPTPKILGVLGTRYVVTDPGTRVSVRGLSYAYRGRDASVLANAYAMPRAIVAAHVHVAAEEGEEVATIASAAFDPRQDAVVRMDELAGNSPPPRVDRDGSVRVVEEENSSVTLKASLSSRSLIVLDDSWAPGWTVQVDGEPARALQTDLVLRGVIVPAGTHTIVWRYRVPGLRLGAAMSGLGLLIAIGWVALIVRARRRAGD